MNRSRIAIVGSGISGLSAAEMLRERHDVTVFERETTAGGHARTLEIDGTPIDTGFIVYNEVNYPLLTGFFRHLAIPTHASDMSFAVRLGPAEREIAFCASSLSGLFAEPRNAFSCAHWVMLSDTLKFFRQAPRLLDEQGDPTLGEFLSTLRMRPPFVQRFLIPMGAAIWSTPADKMLDFPAKTFVRFFQNHGLLSVKGHHPWRTVTGGSRRYVDELTRRLGARLRLNAPVRRVRCTKAGITLVTGSANNEEVFDHVVLACHADEALQLIEQPSNAEQSVLGAFEFQDNVAVLHRDPRLMPKARRAWASWVYAASPSSSDAMQNKVSVTYWMNRLQSLPEPSAFVTLNPDRDVAPALTLDRHVFRHPLFSRRSVAAQSRIDDIQGVRGLWFCGAWQRYGFHEDGIWSAERVARALGCSIPWAQT